ncbi:MAG: GxxExxY protein [Rhodospirillales bacterium]|mgnify:CR=1 FL=1|nr:GxxExxY protein [Alphaproteobacteria bacterium]MCB9981119.1 GxxExxY protein [Rhodospirillales bacterium]
MDANRHEFENMNEPLLLKDEVYQITGCAMSVLNELGHGFAEKVYENALAVEFGLKDIPFSQQPGFEVHYKSQNVGLYVPDFIVFGKVIVELKTIDKIGSNEQGQVLNYLKATGLNVGLILNFKHSKLDWKRIILS